MSLGCLPALSLQLQLSRISFCALCPDVGLQAEGEEEKVGGRGSDEAVFTRTVYGSPAPTPRHPTSNKVVPLLKSLKSLRILGLKCFKILWL